MARRGDIDPAIDYEAVLGVGPGADGDRVRAAWRARAREVHPDAGGDEAAFERARRAYEILADPDLAAHWRFLRSAAATGPAPGPATGPTTGPATGPFPAQGGATDGWFAAPPARGPTPASGSVPLARVRRRPPLWERLVILELGVLAVAVSVLPAFAVPGGARLVSSLPAALASVGVGVVAAQRGLLAGADRSHRVQVIALVWAVVTVGQVIVSSIAGASLLPILPILAVPLCVVSTVLLFPGRRR